MVTRSRHEWDMLVLLFNCLRLNQGRSLSIYKVVVSAVYCFCFYQTTSQLISATNVLIFKSFNMLTAQLTNSTEGNIDESFIMLENHLCRLENYYYTNRLKLDSDKSRLMVISSKYFLRLTLTKSIQFYKTTLL